jgi:hypothetical protein
MNNARLYTLDSIPEELHRKMNDSVIRNFGTIEGFNSVYYGKIRNGKTSSAVRDMLELLDRGEIVVSNIALRWQGFDEYSSPKIRWVRWLSGRTDFYKYEKSNFVYIQPQDLIDNKGDFTMSVLNKMVGVHFFFDEAQWILNSMEKYSPDDPLMVDKLKLVLHGGHYCRSLNIITQRPSNITKNVRSQIHIWYRCEKRLDIGNYMIIQKWTIEDMKDDLPVEYVEKRDKDGEIIQKRVPAGKCKSYFINKRHDKAFKMYDTHAMRSSDAFYPFPDYVKTHKTRKAMIFDMVRGWMPRRAKVARLEQPQSLTRALPVRSESVISRFVKKTPT